MIDEETKTLRLLSDLPMFYVKNGKRIVMFKGHEFDADTVLSDFGLESITDSYETIQIWNTVNVEFSIVALENNIFNIDGSPGKNYDRFISTILNDMENYESD